jgi:prephenate dehydratase
VTSFVFNVRNLPAALYKALGGFATNGVNMTKLESYGRREFTATQFLAEVDGHADDLRSGALEELAFFTTEVKVLGSTRPTRSARLSRPGRPSLARLTQS